jgi:hypothetical protein
VLRLKFRRDRRSGLPIESPFVFYPRLARDTLRKLHGYWSIYRQFQAILKGVKADQANATYSDVAIEPLRENEDAALELFHATRGGEAALARKRLAETIRTDPAAAAVPAE